MHPEMVEAVQNKESLLSSLYAVSLQVLETTGDGDTDRLESLLRRRETLMDELRKLDKHARDLSFELGVRDTNENAFWGEAVDELVNKNRMIHDRLVVHVERIVEEQRVLMERMLPVLAELEAAEAADAGNEGGFELNV